jgi:DNA transformation protein
MDLVEHTLELLAPLGAVRAKRMFGGHGFYIDELFVALIAGERLYLKADAETTARFAAAGSAPFVYDGGAKPITMRHWAAPPEALESPAAMAPWAQRAIAAALRARALSKPRKAGLSKPRKARGRSAPGAGPKPAAPARPKPRARAKRR